jgi:NADH-quinone oxidoreductase subunit H
MLESIGNFASTYQVAIARTVILLVVFGALQIAAAVLVYFERKIAAWTQQRLGPYRVGPVGVLQPVADIVKLIFKEELRPKAADTWLFYLAPIISAVAAYAAVEVVPFGGRCCPTSCRTGWRWPRC